VDLPALGRVGLLGFRNLTQLDFRAAQDSSESRSVKGLVYIFPQRFPRNCVDIEIDVLRIANAFEEKAEIAPALERVQFLIDTRSELGQEKKMKLLDDVNISERHNR
jgi:hypothetical protein